MCKSEEQKNQEATLVVLIIVMFLFGISLGINFMGCDNNVRRDSMRTQIIQELEKK